MASLPTYFDPKLLARIDGLKIRAKHVVDGYLAGTHRSPYRGFSIEFSEHREYAPGDDTRYLDWKILGRTDKLYVKQFEDETNLVSYSVLDASESMNYPSHSRDELTKFEYSSILATAINWLVLRQLDSVSLSVVDESIQATIPPSSKGSQIQEVLQVLSQAKLSGRTSLGPLLRQLDQRYLRRGIYFIFSDFFDDLDQLRDALSTLRRKKHGVTCIQVLADSEVDFPFDRPSRFLGLEGKPTVQADPIRLRDSYLEEMERFLSRTEAMCRSLGAHHHLIKTSTPFDLAISNILRDWS